MNDRHDNPSGPLQTDARAEADAESYRSLLDALRVGVFRTAYDAEGRGRFAFANPALAAMFGFDSVGALLEADPRDLVEPTGRREALALALSQAGRVAGAELRYRRRDGSEFWGALTARVILAPDGRLASTDGFIEDITERRRVAEALRQTAALVAEGERVAKLGHYEFDLATGDVRWSEQMYRLFGYEPGAVQPTVELVRSHVHPEDRASFERMVSSSVEGPGPYDSEYRIIPVGGEARWVHSRGQIVAGTTRVVGTLQDISERKAAEQQRETLQRQFHEAQKLESLGTLAGGIAHDMNNLLGSILGLASLWLGEVEPGTPLHADLTTVEAACRRGRDLTSSLLGFARRGPIRREPVAIGRLVRDLVAMLRRTVPKKVSLELQSAPGELGIEGDSAALTQALINLCLNAVDAIDGDGEVRIEVDLQADAALPGGTGPAVRIRVSDDGRGMPPEVAARALEPFFTTKPQGVGTGLGLAMVHGAVERHGGCLSLETAPGEGTTVTLLLPVAGDLSAEQAAGAAPDAPPVRGRGTVLLVDDEPLVQKVSSRMLRHLGYEVLVAGDGQAALATYREHAATVDAVVLDLMMPRMDGSEALAALLAEHPDARVIVASGYSGETEASTLLEAGARAVLAKPFETDVLARTLARVLAADA